MVAALSDVMLATVGNLGYIGDVQVNRARGDHQADSDADVAIVLRGEIGNRWRVKQQVIEITYPILVDTELCMGPWPIGQAELEAPDRSSNPNLIKNILRDGIFV